MARRSTAVTGAVATLALLATALLGDAARPVLAGWLVALVFWLGPPLGALLLLLVHGVTGGRWGEALRPALAAQAATLPAFLPLAVPVLLGAPLLYPWVDRSALPQPDIAVWLNAPGFALRGVVLLAVWGVAGWRCAMRRPGPLLAALLLSFHLVAASILGIDWMQSLTSDFASTAFGLHWVLLQGLAAIAAVAVLRAAPGEARGDLAGLMLTAALGALYLGFVAFLVSWYGDLPSKVAWYLPRQSGAWAWLGGVSVVLTGLLPVMALMAGRVRGSASALAWLGGLSLLGLAAHWAWVVVPSVGPWAGGAAVLALVAVGGLVGATLREASS